MVLAWIALAAALAIGIAALGATFAQGKATAAAMDAIWRQPEAAGDVRGSLIVALSLMEAIAIYGLLIGLLIIFILPGQI
ncbi:MAG TPA: ATP synthase F0 subunit C [Symbiobacteriaceae bacterium]|jgi:F-type H+-transporting ATPase subunit c|nr:synthase subunit [Symbiobacteriaceae bacterium]HYF76816.1 ATP synthase F0 subunit C [Symbiobacteriaceae bacterium]